MPVLLQTTLLLICSNVFMTFATLSMRQPLTLNNPWAALSIRGAARMPVGLTPPVEPQ